MEISFKIYLVSFLIGIANCVRINSHKVVCDELTMDDLAGILGPAYNSRYMSVDQPKEEEQVKNNNTYGKRSSDSLMSFHVDEDFEHVLDEETPAWKVSNHLSLGDGTSEAKEKMVTRNKRSARGVVKQWECKSKVKWIDLGVNYFPRYLRSVECLNKYCWYGHYKCKPRSFTVKLLRRREDKCVFAKPGTKIGVIGLPHDLRELWVWEERAVNFCCECSM